MLGYLIGSVALAWFIVSLIATFIIIFRDRSRSPAKIGDALLFRPSPGMLVGASHLGWWATFSLWLALDSLLRKGLGEAFLIKLPLVVIFVALTLGILGIYFQQRLTLDDEHLEVRTLLGSRRLPLATLRAVRTKHVTEHRVGLGVMHRRKICLEFDGEPPVWVGGNLIGVNTLLELMNQRARANQALS